jgi:tetratricopeptide (TPR) repeat protein
MKCEICGTESTFEKNFIKEHKSFSQTKRIICSNCWVRRRNRIEGYSYTVALLEGIAGYLLLWHDSSSELGLFLTSVFLFILFLILTIVPHELGHAVMARLLGWRVFAITIGAGKSLWRRNMWGTVVDLHAIPIHGLTQMAPVNPHWYRTKYFLAILAGPAVNFLMMLGVFFWWWNGDKPFDLSALPRAAWLFILANLLVLLVNLFPKQLKSLGVLSDGKQLLSIPLYTKDHVHQRLASRYVLEASICHEFFDDLAGARRWCERGLVEFPDNFQLVYMNAFIYSAETKYDQARELYLKLLERENEPTTMRYTLLNNIAYFNALCGKIELLPEADAFSKEAFEALPWADFIIGTRGTVLVALGQLEEGTNLLNRSLKKCVRPRDKADTYCHLAVAYDRSRKPDEARQHLEMARKVDPKTQLIAWAESKLSSQPPEATASSSAA